MKSNKAHNIINNNNNNVLAHIQSMPNISFSHFHFYFFIHFPFFPYFLNSTSCLMPLILSKRHFFVLFIQSWVLEVIDQVHIIIIIILTYMYTAYGIRFRIKVILTGSSITQILCQNFNFLGAINVQSVAKRCLLLYTYI